jgi:hypothetical protein
LGHSKPEYKSTSHYGPGPRIIDQTATKAHRDKTKSDEIMYKKDIENVVPISGGPSGRHIGVAPIQGIANQNPEMVKAIKFARELADEEIAKEKQSSLRQKLSKMVGKKEPTAATPMSPADTATSIGGKLPPESDEIKTSITDELYNSVDQDDIKSFGHLLQLIDDNRKPIIALNALKMAVLTNKIKIARYLINNFKFSENEIKGLKSEAYYWKRSQEIINILDKAILSGDTSEISTADVGST